jgi:hypothetical protein
LNWDLKDINTWIPQFAALCQPAIVSSHNSFITQLPNSTLNHSIVTQTATEEESSCFREAVKSSVLHDVQMEQAAAFSLAVHYLSLSNPSDCPYDLLRAVPWIQTSIADLEGMSGDERRKLVAIRHALANRVVGLFAAAMRFTSRFSHPSPPYATTIPLAYQTNCHYHSPLMAWMHSVHAICPPWQIRSSSQRALGLEVSAQFFLLI